MATTSPLTSVSTWSQARGVDDQLVCTAVNSQQLEPRDPNRRSETNSSESQLSLQRALRTLRAVRQRYETGRNAHLEARSYSVNVVVDHATYTVVPAIEEQVRHRATDSLRGSRHRHSLMFRSHIHLPRSSAVFGSDGTYCRAVRCN